MSRKNTINAFIVFSVWITFLFLCSLTGVGYTSWLMQKLGLLAATSETKKEIAIAVSCIIGVLSIMLLKNNSDSKKEFLFNTLSASSNTTIPNSAIFNESISSSLICEE